MSIIVKIKKTSKHKEDKKVGHTETPPYLQAYLYSLDSKQIGWELSKYLNLIDSSLSLLIFNGKEKMIQHFLTWIKYRKDKRRSDETHSRGTRLVQLPKGTAKNICRLQDNSGKHPGNLLSFNNSGNLKHTFWRAFKVGSGSS
jgi:hypothetical protein